MPRYTMFLADGSPTRASVGLPRVGWEVLVSAHAGTPSVPHQASHELTHVVQQGGMSSAWLHRRLALRATGAIRPPSSRSPEVDDQVLVSFMHGDRRHALLIVQAGSGARVHKIDGFVIKQASHDDQLVLLDLGVGASRGVRLEVKRKGSAPLSILGGTSTDPEFARDARFAELF